MSVSDPREPARGGPPGPAPFGALLREVRSRAGLSQNALARRAEIDPAYVNRLEKPARTRASRAGGLPRRPVVLRLAAATELGPVDADRLLAAAGHCPEAVTRLGGWDPTLAAVAELLAGPAGPAIRRAIGGLASALEPGWMAAEPDGVLPDADHAGDPTPTGAPTIGPPTRALGVCRVGPGKGGRSDA